MLTFELYDLFTELTEQKYPLELYNKSLKLMSGQPMTDPFHNPFPSAWQSD